MNVISTALAEVLIFVPRLYRGDRGYFMTQVQGSLHARSRSSFESAATSASSISTGCGAPM